MVAAFGLTRMQIEVTGPCSSADDIKSIRMTTESGLVNVIKWLRFGRVLEIDYDQTG